MKPQPRIVRRSMAHRLTHEPPDRAFDDVLAVALAIVLLIVVALLSSVVPLAPA